MKDNKFNPNKVDRDGKAYKVVPKHLRRKVYDLVLELHINDNDGRRYWGLCVILPNILNEIDNSYPRFMESVDTNLIFPEFGEYVGTKTSAYTILFDDQLYHYNTQQWRLKVMLEIVKKMG